MYIFISQHFGVILSKGNCKRNFDTNGTDQRFSSEEQLTTAFGSNATAKQVAVDFSAKVGAQIIKFALP